MKEKGSNAETEETDWEGEDKRKEKGGRARLGQIRVGRIEKIE